MKDFSARISCMRALFIPQAARESLETRGKWGRRGNQELGIRNEELHRTIAIRNFAHPPGYTIQVTGFRIHRTPFLTIHEANRRSRCILHPASCILHPASCILRIFRGFREWFRWSRCPGNSPSPVRNESNADSNFRKEKFSTSHFSYSQHANRLLQLHSMKHCLFLHRQILVHHHHD